MKWNRKKREKEAEIEGECSRGWAKLSPPHHRQVRGSYTNSRAKWKHALGAGAKMNQRVAEMRG